MRHARSAGDPWNDPRAKLACQRTVAFVRRLIRRITIFISLMLASGGRAQTPATPSGSAIVADRIVHNAATGETLLQGHAQMTDGALVISADELKSNQATGVVTAEGTVVLNRGELRLLADRLTYERSRGFFTAENIRLGSYPYFLEGISVAGTREEMTIKGARASYGEPGPWQPTLSADQIIYAPGKALRAQSAALGIGSTLPLRIPQFNHAFGSPISGKAAIAGGFRSSLGAFVDTSLQTPVRPWLNLGADLAVYTRRGVLLGPSGSYRGAENDDRLQGHFRSGYIKDHGDKSTDILGRAIPQERAFGEWHHHQRVGENITVAAQLNWWRDSEILRDFRPRAFFPVQAPDSFMEAAYADKNYSFSIFSRFQPNSFQRVQERLPELRYDLLPSPLGQGFNHRFTASAVILRERQVNDHVLPAPTFPLFAASTALAANAPSWAATAAAMRLQQAGPEYRSSRLDGYYAIDRPFAWHDWLAFTPTAGARITHYGDPRITTFQDHRPTAPLDATLASPGNYTRALGEFGFNAAVRTSAIFDYKNAFWHIDGLRHLFTPRLDYRYIPEANSVPLLSRVPPIDRRTFSTYLPTLGLGDPRNIDDLGKTNTLRLAFDNTIQTRDPVAGSRDLLAVKVANDFRFYRQPAAKGTERKVSEIHTELAFSPASWLSAELYQSFAPQTFKLRELNSGLQLRDGEVWSVRFSNNFLSQELHDYQLDARMRLNERYQALTRLHYDVRQQRFNEQAYGLTQNLGNTWLLSYIVSFYAGPRRESHFGLNFQIAARGF